MEPLNDKQKAVLRRLVALFRRAAEKAQQKQSELESAVREYREAKASLESMTVLLTGEEGWGLDTDTLELIPPNEEDDDGLAED